MPDNATGRTWPLNVIFVVALIGGIVGLIGLPVGTDKLSEPGTIITLWIVAGVTCLMLFVPRIYLTLVKLPAVDTLGDRINSIHSALRGDDGAHDRIGELNTAIGELRTAVNNLQSNLTTRFTALNGRLDAMNGDMQTARDLLATGAVHTSLADIGTRLTAMGDVRASLDGITGQLATGDVRRLLSDANAKLDAIKTKVQA
jgi:hypothetical protein